MKPRLPILSFVLLLLVLQAFQAFNQQISFNRVPPPDGNTFEWVTGFTQDLNGYMWIATDYGLYQFDGFRFNHYVHEPLNPNSLAENPVESVYADTDGTLCVGTLGAGLDRFDRVKGIFTHFHLDANHPASLGNDKVKTILRDKQGILWIGTHGGEIKVESTEGEGSEFIILLNSTFKI